MASIRKDRVEGEMQKILSSIIAQEIRDPAVPPLTSVMGVEVASDFSNAKVRISILQDDAGALRTAVNALNKAAGYVRLELGRRINLRHTPRLTFVEDRSIHYSIQVQKVLDQIHHEQHEN